GADMLSRENALNEFLRTGDQDNIVSIKELDHRQDGALDEARELSSDSAEELATIERQSAAEDRWVVLAQAAIDARNAGREGPSPRGSRGRVKAADDSLAANRAYQKSLDTARVEELSAAAIVPVKLILLLSVLFGLIALAFVLRRRRLVAA